MLYFSSLEFLPLSLKFANSLPKFSTKILHLFASLLYLPWLFSQPVIDSWCWISPGSLARAIDMSVYMCLFQDDNLRVVKMVMLLFVCACAVKHRTLVYFWDNLIPKLQWAQSSWAKLGLVIKQWYSNFSVYQDLLKCRLLGPILEFLIPQVWSGAQ